MSDTSPANAGTRPDDAEPGTPVGGFEPPRGDEVELPVEEMKDYGSPAKAKAEPKTPTVSEEVLRNKGVPIKLYLLDEGGNIKRDSKDELQTEERFLRLDANAIAELEEAFDGVSFEVTELITQGESAGEVVRFEKKFYGIDGFQASLERRTTTTLLRALSIALGEPTEIVGKLLLTGEMSTYHTAFGAAFAMSNGADPSVASRMIDLSIEAQHREAEKMKTELAESLGGDDESESGPEGD